MLFASPPKVLLITPGASADRDHSTLLALADALPEIQVERLTLGTTSVPRAVTKIVDAVETLVEQRGVATGEIVIGGRSFGGRACSVAVAEGLDVGGLALLSYPLHPPGKPEKLRVEHFGDITVPTLFVSGDRDPFGTHEEFAEHTATIAGPTEFEWVKGTHSPKGAAEQHVVEIVRRYLLESVSST